MIPQSQTAAPPTSLSIAEERAILTVTCLAAFLFFNSFGSISVALPTIQKQFGNSLSEIQWITLMGVVTISSLSFCFGRAGGILGQRRLYKIGVALYAAGAGLGALAGSFSQLLIARAVMAVGLAMALPMSTALLASSFAARAARSGAWHLRFGDRGWTHDRTDCRWFSFAAGRLDLDLLDEFHRRLRRHLGGGENFSRRRRAAAGEIRHLGFFSIADWLSIAC